MNQSYVLRSAEGEDHSFLEQLLVQAYNWDGQQHVTLEQVRTDSQHQKYLDGWKQLGDVGVLAHGHDGEMAGGAWARAVPREQAGYGWVAPDVPELGMAVLPGFQGQGLGVRLLDACLDALREQGFQQVSLSVDLGNTRARKLYHTRGFGSVEHVADSETLVLDLSREN